MYAAATLLSGVYLEVPEGHIWGLGSSDLNFRFCDISSLRVGHAIFGAENIFIGVSRHPPSADMVGCVG